MSAIDELRDAAEAAEVAARVALAGFPTDASLAEVIYEGRLYYAPPDLLTEWARRERAEYRLRHAGRPLPISRPHQDHPHGKPAPAPWISARGAEVAWLAAVALNTALWTAWIVRAALAAAFGLAP